jgi:hypothetical protein
MPDGRLVTETKPLSTTELRYEIKLVCQRHRLGQARAWFRLHPAGFVVAYPQRRVNNLYLDTPHLSSLQDNLGGISARQKLRLRWYGESTRHIRAYLELKRKQNMLGYKRRAMLACDLDLALPWRDILEAIRANSDPDWLPLLQTACQPVLINHYEREYYVTLDGAVRITLDRDQVAYGQRLSLRPNLQARLHIADTVVIEVKAPREQAERLQDIVSRFPVPRSRSSKYVLGALAAPG